LKERIILWSDNALYHFCMAKFFQKKYDCELYGIIDVNDELKKFFLKQNIVKFKKTFYIREHIPKKIKKTRFEISRKF